MISNNPLLLLLLISSLLYFSLVYVIDMTITYPSHHSYDGDDDDVDVLQYYEGYHV